MAGGGAAKGGLIQTDWRPPLPLSGSDIVMIDGNFTIEMKAPTVIIYDQQGCEITKIWGDPHVNENGAKRSGTSARTPRSSSPTAPRCAATPTQRKR